MSGPDEVPGVGQGYLDRRRNDQAHTHCRIPSRDSRQSGWLKADHHPEEAFRAIRACSSNARPRPSYIRLGRGEMETGIRRRYVPAVIVRRHADHQLECYSNWEFDDSLPLTSWSVLLLISLTPTRMLCHICWNTSTLTTSVSTQAHSRRLRSCQRFVPMERRPWQNLDT